jgi:hypothetical protein|tara:strand:- start:524 stop:1150 length:627 start_codon:yes stop_codon:yes gene_type:complete
MIYTKNWAYIHIPKTAGMNFIKRLEWIPHVVSWADLNLKRHMDHMPLQWWLDRGTITTQKVFTFVRNPYARIVSLYNHLAISGHNPGLPEFKECIMTGIVDKLDKNIHGQRIVNWELWKGKEVLGFDFGLPQYKFIENDQGIDVKYYKMETELPLVEKYVGHTFTDTNMNAMPHAPWQTYYDSETKEMVNEKYKEDFKRFNYDEYLPM